eukprot:11669759-Alexandrium_andersonii.AAC.1
METACWRASAPGPSLIEIGLQLHGRPHMNGAIAGGPWRFKRSRLKSSCVRAPARPAPYGEQFKTNESNRLPWLTWLLVLWKLSRTLGHSPKAL